MEFYWIQIWQLFSYYVEIAAPLLFIPWFIAAMFSASASGIVWILGNIFFAGILLYYMKRYQTYFAEVYSTVFMAYPMLTLFGDLVLIAAGWVLIIQATSQNLFELAAISDKNRPFYVQTLCFVTWGRICGTLLLLTTIFLDMSWFLYLRLFVAMDFSLPIIEIREDPHTILDSFFSLEKVHSSDQCPICLEDQDETTLKSKSCGHEFHKKCLVDLLVHNVICPMCVRRFGGERYEVYHDGQFKVVIDNDEDTVTEPVIVVSRERV